MKSKCETCIHSVKQDEKYICDISGFDINGSHCAGCVSYNSIENFRVCECCKEIVQLDELILYGNNLICQKCLKNEYGDKNGYC